MSDTQLEVQPEVEVAAFSFEGKTELPVVEAPVVDEVIEPVVEIKPTVEVVVEPIVEKKEEIAPVAVEEKKVFANEDSENIYNLLVDGKTEEVLSVLNEQKKLKEVDKLDPSEIIKLNLQYQHKELNQSEINDLFNDTYEIPEPPQQGLVETDDEFEIRTALHDKEVKRIESRIARDSKPAIAELQKQLKDIVLPTLPKAESKAVEPTQEELDAQKAANDLFLKQVKLDVQNFDGFNTTFKDEEVEINVGYKLTKEEKEKIEPLVALSATNAGAFFQQIGWLNDKGEIDTKKMSQDLPLILNRDKVLQKIASETGNKRHEASIKSIKNIDYSGGKASSPELGKTPEVLQREFATHFFQNA